MQPIIEIKDLSKSYGTKPAVKHLDLDVYPGEIFGFVGPNGAGKTSTIRIMATLLAPTSGDIRVGGFSVQGEPKEVRRLIGYMPDFFGVYHDMKVWEYLDFFAACYGVGETERAPLVDELLELVELHHRREDWVDELSRGMKQRLSLARTLVHDPQLLILDEPASGLDPRARVEIRELLLELARMGKTVFFSTHILSDVAQISTRVGIIEAGELVAVGDLDSLQHQLIPTRTVEITVLSQLPEASALLDAYPGVASLEKLPEQNNGRPDKLRLQFSGDDQALSALLAALIQAEIPVLNFHEESRDLETVFLRATKGLVT